MKQEETETHGERKKASFATSYKADSKKERRGNSFFEWLVTKFYEFENPRNVERSFNFTRSFDVSRDALVIHVGFASN